jgi:hypothetical protein
LPSGSRPCSASCDVKNNNGGTAAMQYKWSAWGLLCTYSASTSGPALPSGAGLALPAAHHKKVQQQRSTHGQRECYSSAASASGSALPSGSRPCSASCTP